MRMLLVWHCRRLLRIVGWSGVAAMGLALTAVLLHFEAVLPLRANVTDLRMEAEHLRVRVATRRVADKHQDPGGQLREFYRFFPDGEATVDGDAMADVMARIYEAAAQENLVLEHGEYQLSPTQEGGLLRYDLTLPIKGSYPKLRRFIVKVLQDNRSLALEGVSFSRQAVIEIGVSAQVRMTLYLRAGSA